MLWRPVWGILGGVFGAGFTLAFGAEHWIGGESEFDALLESGAVSAGDSILVRKGTYLDTRFDFAISGKPGAPITLRAETPGGVILQGRSGIDFGGDHLVASGFFFYNGDDPDRPVDNSVVEFRAADGTRHAHHCRLTDCAILEMDSRAIDTKDNDKDGDTTDIQWIRAKWVLVYGTHNRVDHCFFAGKQTQGALVAVEMEPPGGRGTAPYPEYAHRIDHNFFGPIPEGWMSNQFEAIRVGTSFYSSFHGAMRIEDNQFFHCDGETEVVSNKSCDNFYRRNAFIGCRGTLVMRHGDRCMVEHNVILGKNRPDSGGIRINGEGHTLRGNYIEGTRGTGMRAGIVLRAAAGVDTGDLSGGYEQVRNATIVHNTIIDATESLRLVELGAKKNHLLPRASIVANNLIVSENGPLVTQAAAPSDMTYAGNVVFGADPGIEPDGFSRLDPMLVRRSDGLAAPAEDSPLVGMAAPAYPGGAVDMDGDPRRDPATVGADEPYGRIQLLAPIDPRKVGPAWIRTLPADLFPVVLKDWWEEWETPAPWHALDGRALLLEPARIREVARARAPEAKALRADLLRRAEAILEKKQRYSVTENARIPPSGNRHDYYSTGPYWWPSPDTPDGLPYIRRDGKFNPERDRVSDREPLRSMIMDTRIMAMAYALTGDEGYARWGHELLRTWFLDAETAMRPNLNHAQAVPGVSDGRGTGIIDTHPFAELVDALVLLESSPAFPESDRVALRRWFAAFLEWLQTSPLGAHESAARNNHGTAFDLQVAAILGYLGESEPLRELLESSVKARINSQIQPDGAQPHELARTRTWSYCTENLEHFFKLARIGERVGVDLFHYTSPEGGSLKNALDFVLPGVCDQTRWSHPQSTAWEMGFVRNVLAIAEATYDEPAIREAESCLPPDEGDVMSFFLRKE